MGRGDEKVKVNQIFLEDMPVQFRWMAKIISTALEEALWVVDGVGGSSSIKIGRLNF